jgi:hypothetical protein
MLLTSEESRISKIRSYQNLYQKLPPTQQPRKQVSSIPQSYHVTRSGYCHCRNDIQSILASSRVIYTPLVFLASGCHARHAVVIRGVHAVRLWYASISIVVGSLICFCLNI